MLRLFTTDYPSHSSRQALQALNRFLPAVKKGNEAVVENVVVPGAKWRIRYRATSWCARCIQDGIEFAPEDTVYVVGRDGLTLIVEPVRSEN